MTLLMSQYFSPAKVRPSLEKVAETLLDRTKFPFLDEITAGLPFVPTSQKISSKSFFTVNNVKTYYKLKKEFYSDHFTFAISVASQRWCTKDNKFSIYFDGKDNAINRVFPSLTLGFVIRNRYDTAYDGTVPFSEFVENVLLPDFLKTYDEDMSMYKHYKKQIDALTAATEKYR